MRQVREKGVTSHPLIKAVYRARTVNNACGYPAVTPWTVGDLDEEWLDTFDQLFDFESRERAIADGQARAKQAFEQILAANRANHPSYRKYLK